jgi:hypothetical protein
MIKLVDIIKEGTLQLTSDERRQVEEILPNIVDVVSGKYLGDNNGVKVGVIKFTSADGTPGEVEIIVGNDLSHSGAGGYFQTNDPKNPTDNRILIQQVAYQPYFNIIGKTYSTLTGDKNTGIEELRGVLKHELIHAKDPARNQYRLKEPYDPSKEEVYFKSWAEFQTMTGQFFEAITTGVDRILEQDPSEKNIKKIEKALKNILDFYSGKITITGKEMLSQDTADFIQNTGKRNIFQSLIKFAENTLNTLAGAKLQPNALDVYVYYINQIKKYNPEGYKEFLTDLYKTIDAAKDKVNAALDAERKQYYDITLKSPGATITGMRNTPSNIKIREMQYINEAKRFQKLAGILDENQIFENDVFDLEAIKKQIEDKVEQNPNLEEALGILGGIGLVLAIPALLQGLATLIEKGNRYFTKKFTPEQIAQIKAYNKQAVKTGGHKQYTSGISKEIDDFAHWLHDMCIKPIEGVLYVISKIPVVNRISWIKDESKRHKLAEAIYLVIALALGGIGLAQHAVSITGVIDAVKLGDVAIDSNVLASRTGLLKNLPDLISKLVV